MIGILKGHHLVTVVAVKFSLYKTDFVSNTLQRYSEEVSISKKSSSMRLKFFQHCKGMKELSN